MTKPYLRTHGKPALDLIEEAFVLLRTGPLSVLAVYYLGTTPFVAGFLIFCAILSRRVEAAGYVAEAALIMTGLFIWMKFFQARFARMILARLQGGEMSGWKPGEIARSLAIQATLQATGLILLPLSALAILPFGWVYAFYQNVSAMDDGRGRLSECVRVSARQSALWTGQNHLALLILSNFGFIVFMNWIMLGAMAPQLLNMFFGIESVFTQSPLSIFNTTFLAAAVALTYLTVDPLMKTCYVLRCFQGASLRSGDDLRSEIRRLSGRIAALSICLVCFMSIPTASAQEAVPKTAVESESLDTSIDTVVQQAKYMWRTPQKKTPSTENGWLKEQFRSIAETLNKFLRSLGEWIKKLSDWLLPKERKTTEGGSLMSWLSSHGGILSVVAALVVATLAVVGFRMLETRREAKGSAMAVTVHPDLEDENTRADELPEDDWTRLGRRLLEEGDRRRALRAFYLATLAHLASRGLITIARWKSNRDYERELQRRGHTVPQLPQLFGENVGIFDRTWYGLHEANPDMVQRFLGNLEKMKGTA